MKKLSLYLLAFSLLLLIVPMQLKAAALDKNPVTTDSTRVTEIALVNTLTERLDEIASIDKKNMRPAERRELRKEVRSINRQLKAANRGGVYISVGALLVVILLLILLL